MTRASDIPATGWRDLVKHCVKGLRIKGCVLVLGPAGSGKSTLALQAAGQRRGPVVEADCTMLGTELGATALRGIDGGRATGVVAQVGYFQQASGGELILDEIGELTHTAQASLLKLLDRRGSYTRVGSSVRVARDFGVIACTNRDLLAMTRQKDANGRPLFRKDLYDRLARCVVTMPPIKERPDVVVEVAKDVLAQLKERGEIPHGSDITRAGLDALMQHDFSEAWLRTVEDLVQDAVWCALDECDDGVTPVIIEPRHFGSSVPSWPRKPTENERAVYDALDGEMPVREIAEKADVKPDTASKILKRLNGWGLVEGAPGQRWRRCRYDAVEGDG